MESEESERRSMRELEAVARQAQGPIRCRYCGCPDFRVHRTWRLRDGTVRRLRICRHCGRDMYDSDETVRHRW